MSESEAKVCAWVAVRRICIRVVKAEGMNNVWTSFPSYWDSSELAPVLCSSSLTPISPFQSWLLPSLFRLLLTISPCQKTRTVPKSLTRRGCTHARRTDMHRWRACVKDHACSGAGQARLREEGRQCDGQGLMALGTINIRIYTTCIWPILSVLFSLRRCGRSGVLNSRKA